MNGFASLRGLASVLALSLCVLGGSSIQAAEKSPAAKASTGAHTSMVKNSSAKSGMAMAGDLSASADALAAEVDGVKLDPNASFEQLQRQFKSEANLTHQAQEIAALRESVTARMTHLQEKIRSQAKQAKPGGADTSKLSTGVSDCQQMIEKLQALSTNTGTLNTIKNKEWLIKTWGEQTRLAGELKALVHSYTTTMYHGSTPAMQHAKATPVKPVSSTTPLSR